MAEIRTEQMNTEKVNTAAQNAVPEAKGMEIITLEPQKKAQKEKAPILRVAAYARVSHETEMDSFDAQVGYYTTFIEGQTGWQLAGIYTDPMISGTSAQKRPGFLQMVKDCEDGKIDLILCKSISRFARNTMDTLTYVRHLQNQGADIIFETNGIDTRDAYSEMMLTVWAAFAQEESRSISENTKWGIRKRFEEGVARWCKIYGYRKGNDGSQYEIVPEEAENIRLIFALADRGKSIDQIKKELEERNIPTPTGKTAWTRSNIHKMLRNEKYVGDLKLQKFYTEDHLSHHSVRNEDAAVRSFYIKNHHEPIVTRKVFDRVQTILEMKSMNGKDPYIQYPFGDMLRCPICGSPLHQRQLTITSRRGKAWYCEHGCGGFLLRSSVVEGAVMRALSEMDVKQVRGMMLTAKTEKRREAAGLMLEYRELYDEGHTTVEYCMVDDLIDHIEMGAHTLVGANTLRANAAQRGNVGTAVDDRTITVYWKCGLMTTVPTGIIADRENPRMLAKAWKESCERIAQRENQQIVAGV